MPKEEREDEEESEEDELANDTEDIRNIETFNDLTNFVPSQRASPVLQNNELIPVADNLEQGVESTSDNALAEQSEEETIVYNMPDYGTNDEAIERRRDRAADMDSVPQVSLRQRAMSNPSADNFQRHVIPGWQGGMQEEALRAKSSAEDYETYQPKMKSKEQKLPFE